MSAQVVDDFSKDIDRRELARLQNQDLSAWMSSASAADDESSTNAQMTMQRGPDAACACFQLNILLLMVFVTVSGRRTHLDRYGLKAFKRLGSLCLC